MDITDYGTLGQIAVAFAAGLVSFLSPCVLPLVPGYISIISGSSLDQLKARRLPTHVSVKLSHLGLDVDQTTHAL